MPNIWHFVHSPLTPQWVNVLIVAVLAEITRRYAKSTKRQADAAEAQAKAANQQANAAMKQAEVAERTLSVMQAQIQEQAGIGTAVLEQCIRELQHNAKHWGEQFVAWGALNQGLKVELLPAQWSVAMEHALRRLSESIKQELNALQVLARRTELEGNSLVSLSASIRDVFKVGETQRNLDQIQRDCQRLLTEVKPVAPTNP